MQEIMPIWAWLLTWFLFGQFIVIGTLGWIFGGCKMYDNKPRSTIKFIITIPINIFYCAMGSFSKVLAITMPITDEEKKAKQDRVDAEF